MLKLTSFVILVVLLCASSLVNANNELHSLFKHNHRRVGESANVCKDVTFPNGTKLSFAQTYKQLAAVFPSIQQTGISPSSWTWQASLCDKYYIPPQGGICSDINGLPQNGFLSQRPSVGTSQCYTEFYSTPNVEVAAGGDHVTFTYATTYGDMSWNSTVKCYCDPSASTMISPTNSYSAGQSKSDVIELVFNVAASACCVGSMPPPPPPQPTSAPTPSPNGCGQVNFPNGSSISFANTYDKLSAFFPSMKQLGLAPGTWTWQFSMCDTTYVPSPQGSVCTDIAGHTTPAFLSQRASAGSSDCDVTFTSLPDVEPGADGNHITFTYLSTSDNLAWRTSVHCYCDRSVSTLSSPSNSYTAGQDNDRVVELNFNVSSSSCCVDYIPPPPQPTSAPPPVTHGCPAQVTFANGSFASLTNFPQLAGYYPNLQQIGIAPGNYAFEISLCDRFYSPASTTPCEQNGRKIDAFLSQRISNNTCAVVFPTSPQVTPSPNGDHIRFSYNSVSNGLEWNADVHCFCDSAVTRSLLIPSNSYLASQSNTGVIDLKFDVVSASCCALMN